MSGGDAQRAELPVAADASSFVWIDNGVIGVDARRQVPEPVASPASGGRDLAAIN